MVQAGDGGPWRPQQWCWWSEEGRRSERSGADGELQGTRLSTEVKGESTNSESTLHRPTVKAVGLGGALAVCWSKARLRIVN